MTQVTASAGRYLEAMYYIVGEGEDVRPGRLAEWLGVSPPSVSEAVRKLAREGLVTIDAERRVQFTADGLAAAENIVRRHRIAEVWLTKLGLDWASADHEAQAVGPALSDEVLAALHRSIGSPDTCPHGNLIPGRPARTDPLSSLASLPESASGEVSRISEVAEHDAPALLTLFFESGLVPGALATVTRRGAAGDVDVAVAGRQVSLTAAQAAAIWVVPAE